MRIQLIKCTATVVSIIKWGGTEIKAKIVRKWLWHGEFLHAL